MKLLFNINCLISNIPDPFAQAGPSLHSSPATCQESQALSRSSELTKLFCKIMGSSLSQEQQREATFVNTCHILFTLVLCEYKAESH